MESPFRIALVVILVLIMGAVIPFRLRARTDERFDRREEGIWLALALRLGGLALWVFTFAYLINPDRTAWAAIPVPDWVRWTGVVSGVLCTGLMVWTLRALGKNLTDTVAIRREATLVTHGPYCFVRHPFYLGAALLMLSVTLLTANAAIGLASLWVLGLLLVRTPTEERKLAERFGDQYRAYRERTGAFLPKWPRSAH